MRPLWDYDGSFGRISGYGSDIASGFMVDEDATDNAALPMYIDERLQHRRTVPRRLRLLYNFYILLYTGIHKREFMRKSDRNAAGATSAGSASGVSLIVYHCLVAGAILLALTIASVTVYTVISRSFAKGEPVYALPEKHPSAPDALAVDGGIFSAIGRVRTFTADNQTVIVSIAFPYNKEDVPFTEELVSKIMDFRNITFAFFNSRSAEELRNMGEDAVKVELLSQYNGVLKLGRIPLLYFNDFMTLE
ncbi:MAG: hypothetical protein LBG43_00535 [Treponema sp.]|nr:hypothetical protein [Treponema sp.]